MEKSIYFETKAKKYTLYFNDLKPENIIFQAEDKTSGSFYKKNIKYNYKIGCGYTFKIQKTQLTSAKSPAAFLDFMQGLIDNNFALIWIYDIFSGLEKMKENKNA